MPSEVRNFQQFAVLYGLDYQPYKYVAVSRGEAVSRLPLGVGTERQSPQIQYSKLILNTVRSYKSCVVYCTYKKYSTQSQKDLKEGLCEAGSRKQELGSRVIYEKQVSSRNNRKQGSYV